jgi:hypothetical protein
MNATRRSDGLDDPMSPNGPHPLYYVREPGGEIHGPYSCSREAELSQKSDGAVIVDHKGRLIETFEGG